MTTRTARACPSGGDATARDEMSAEEYQVAVRKAKQMPKEKAALFQWLAHESKRRFLTAIAEYRFHPKRRWRFDWAFPNLKLAIEFDGLYGGGAHTSVKMVAKDSEKMNQAAILGWVVIRVNSQSLRDGSGYRDIEQAIDMREQEHRESLRRDVEALWPKMEAGMRYLSDK